MTETEIKDRLVQILDAQRVLDDEATLARFGVDQTECDPVTPLMVVQPLTTEEVQSLVRFAAEHAIPLTPRVAGTNLGGLAIPAPGGLVLDLTRMNRILEVNQQDMYAVIEPGVTFAQIKEHLDSQGIDLVMGYPLSPPWTSVLINCLLDGLSNLSLRHGSMAEWLSGVEAVLGDGSLVVTGSRVVTHSWHGRPPLPDLTGLFVSFQGTTGIVTKGAVQLQPRRPFRCREFVMTYDRKTTYRAMRELARLGIHDDIGGLSWPTGKMLFGISEPGPKDPGEPEFFLYLDTTGNTAQELELRRAMTVDYIEDLRRQGHPLEDPVAIETLCRLNSRFEKFADFPTHLDFLTENPGGGLTWMGTYGPMSHFDEAADRGVAIQAKHGFAPTLVSRPMKGGHYGVLRWIMLFNHGDPLDTSRVRACQEELLDMILELGFVMYKTPVWAINRIRDRYDPGFVRLFDAVRKIMDPQGILNPDKYPLGKSS
ncbi:MAG: FAD-binding oxidoreductase [Bradymonadales bacterium]|nr:FAD-binding oxidoreductase [Bradymonadales bacterium]